MIPKPDTPAWKGPLYGGVTQSLLTRFLECPFRFYLYAICGLVETKPDNENLIWGDVFHKGLEHYVKGDSLQISIDFMHKYLNERYPKAPPTFKYTTANMLKVYPIKNFASWGEIDTEVEFRQEHIIRGRLTSLRGKIDLLNKHRTKIGDHKGKGRNAQSETSIRRDIRTDLQMNLYAWSQGCISDWLYDVIKIPEQHYRAPARRAGESAEAWADRVFNTHKDYSYGFPIKTCPGVWINQIPHYQPESDIRLYMELTIFPIIEALWTWWDYVTSSDFDPNNPLCYNHIFYRKPVRLFDPSRTKMFECNYYSYLIGESSIEDLTPVKSFYAELSEE